MDNYGILTLAYCKYRIPVYFCGGKFLRPITFKKPFTITALFYSPFYYFSIYKIIVVTSPNVNGPIPESTLYSYSDDNWRQYNYYVTALDYHNSQNTTLVIGTGNIYTFEGGARYIDAPLESGRSYRVFIRLYSSASDPVRREGGGGERGGGRERERGREGGKDRGREGERERFYL